MAEDNVDQPAAEEDPWGAALAEQTQAEEAQKKHVPEEQGIDAKPAQATIFKEFSAGDIKTNTPNDIDFILDIPVQLTVELGRTKIAIKNLLQLAQGSVVELDGMAGEPMDVLVNGCLIAQGEVVVVNDKFGIRLTDIITPAERIRKLNR
ncbi:flagellar motor switch protein FliN/FliY [Herbaspirillum sp. Sphag1AN]|uniref:flagellar motor switch protein FliN n=1 Tax=unclassified Herbaspirillum TaxID=2624150 RepID=UPI00160D4EAD|nr:MULTISPECIES: flagellar motor switch protein FliN [unclassified Herbaspirillum]MBB3211021.1 flagellar motor switch protein FliN/FliY [Herbaspirillum sp. Sphag1AN]MBB3244650.1 flagellar motor switch protein FliN/FliY [Herbaspirillum sp. Sphag64]